MIVDTTKRCGVRSTEVPIAHGFRKFFTTQLIHSKVNPEIREMLLGHKIGLASTYYRPIEDEMYAEYEKAVDNLTIDQSNRLQRKIETLTIEKSRLDRKIVSTIYYHYLPFILETSFHHFVLFSNYWDIMAQTQRFFTNYH